MNYWFFLRGEKNIIIDPAKHLETIVSENTPHKLFAGIYVTANQLLTMIFDRIYFALFA